MLFGFPSETAFGFAGILAVALIFFLRDARDYYSRRPRGPVFLLLDFPSIAALALKRNGPAAGSILALARAASTTVRAFTARK